VALTRQRESAQVFVAEETARDARQLARQMGRGEVRAASVAWATADELALELRQRGGESPEVSRTARPEEAPGIRTTERDPGREDWSRTAAGAVPKLDGRASGAYISDCSRSTAFGRRRAWKTRPQRRAGPGKGRRQAYRDRR
jgi:hypothetical protein